MWELLYINPRSAPTLALPSHSDVGSGNGIKVSFLQCVRKKILSIKQ